MTKNDNTGDKKIFRAFQFFYWESAIYKMLSKLVIEGTLRFDVTFMIIVNKKLYGVWSASNGVPLFMKTDNKLCSYPKNVSVFPEEIIPS